MYSSLSCVVSPGNDASFDSTLSAVCGDDRTACAGIRENGFTGQYGKYSMCNSTEQLGYALNEYYSAKGESASACDFNGAARVQTPAQPSGICKVLLAEKTSSATAAASSATTTHKGPSSPSASHGLSGGAKAGIGVGVGVGGAALLGVGAFLLWRRRKSKNVPPYNVPPFETVPETDMTEESDPAAMLSNEGGRYELEQPRAELPTGRETQELPERHGQSELGRSTSTTVGLEGVESRHEMTGNENNGATEPVR